MSPAASFAAPSFVFAGADASKRDRHIFPPTSVRRDLCSGLSHRHGSRHRDRRDENLGPQLARPSPAALYGSLPALSPSKGRCGVALKEMTKKCGQRTSYQHNPERIRVPALAVYAVRNRSTTCCGAAVPIDHDSRRSFIARTTGDPAIRERVEKLIYQLTRARVDDHEKWFKMVCPTGARRAEISGPHFLFVTNQVEVVEQIEAFVGGNP